MIAWSNTGQHQQFGGSDGTRCQYHFRRRLDGFLLTFMLKRDADCTVTVEQNLQQVAQLSQRDRAAVWVSCGADINVVFRIQRTLL